MRNYWNDENENEFRSGSKYGFSLEQKKVSLLRLLLCMNDTSAVTMKPKKKNYKKFRGTGHTHFVGIPLIYDVWL